MDNHRLLVSEGVIREYKWPVHGLFLAIHFLAIDVLKVC